MTFDGEQCFPRVSIILTLRGGDNVKKSIAINTLRTFVDSDTENDEDEEEDALGEERYFFFLCIFIFSLFFFIFLLFNFFILLFLIFSSIFHFFLIVFQYFLKMTRMRRKMQ